MDPEQTTGAVCTLGHFSAIIMHVYLPCPHPPFKMNASILEYPWMLYTFHEFMAVCRYMYIHCDNLIVTQQMGETPLHHAASSGDAEMVNTLLKAGSKVDEKDKVSYYFD